MVQLPPFALDHWLSAHDFVSPPIAYNLASSTGPRWSVADLCALSDPSLTLDDVVLSYAPPAGAPALRSAIAAFHGVDPDMVVATTGASEAPPGRTHIFCCPIPAIPPMKPSRGPGALRRVPIGWSATGASPRIPTPSSRMSMRTPRW